MVGAVLAGAQRGSADRISGVIFAATVLLSLLFNIVLGWMLWEFLFSLKPLDSEIPSKSPLVALLIRLSARLLRTTSRRWTIHSYPRGYPIRPQMLLRHQVS